MHFAKIALLASASVAAASAVEPRHPEITEAPVPRDLLDDLKQVGTAVVDDVKSLDPELRSKVEKHLSDIAGKGKTAYEQHSSEILNYLKTAASEAAGALSTAASDSKKSDKSAAGSVVHSSQAGAMAALLALGATAVGFLMI